MRLTMRSSVSILFSRGQVSPIWYVTITDWAMGLSSKVSALVKRPFGCRSWYNAVYGFILVYCDKRSLQTYRDFLFSVNISYRYFFIQFAALITAFFALGPWKISRYLVTPTQGNCSNKSCICHLGHEYLLTKELLFLEQIFLFVKMSL